MKAYEKENKTRIKECEVAQLKEENSLDSKCIPKQARRKLNDLKASKSPSHVEPPLCCRILFLRSC